MNKYSDFSKDLLELYCKTGKKEIEDLFLRFAATQDFPSWVKAQQDISGLKDNSVLLALKWLARKMSKTVTPNDILQSLYNDKEFYKLAPYMMSLAQLAKTEPFAELLSPFSPIFASMSVLNIAAELPDIGSDLTTIKNTYSPSVETEDAEEAVRRPVQKMTYKAKREMLYQNLLRRFSADVANAAVQYNYVEFANEIRSGILAMPFPLALGKHFDSADIPKLDDVDFRVSKRMADEFMNKADLRYEASLYDDAKTEFLLATGQITPETAHNLKIEMERQKAYTQMHGEQDEELESVGFKDKVPIEVELNPKYLYLVSTYFVMIQRYLKMPMAFR